MLKYDLKTEEKNFLEIQKNLTLSIGDVSATEAQSGHDVGIVSLTGELVRVQMNKKGTNPESPKFQKYTEKRLKKTSIFGKTFEIKKKPFKLEREKLRLHLN